MSEGVEEVCRNIKLNKKIYNLSTNKLFFFRVLKEHSETLVRVNSETLKIQASLPPLKYDLKN
jgi:hypothetical protein